MFKTKEEVQKIFNNGVERKLFQATNHKEVLALFGKNQ